MRQKPSWMYLILISSLISSAYCSLDYSSDYLLDCSESKLPYEDISQILIIRPIDRWVFLILGPFAIMATLFIIFTFIKYPTTRKQPGDIILAISISDLIMCLHWMISSGYAVTFGVGPDQDGGFCQTNAFFSTAAGTSEFLYNCCFCLYIIFVIRNNLKGQNIPQKLFHAVCCGITISVVILLFTTDNAGLTLFGTCSFKINNGFPVFGVVILFIYLMVSWYTIWYFKKSVPKNAVFQKLREEFLKYYFYYVVSTSIVWTILAFSNLFAGLNCSSFHKPGLNVLITIGNAVKIISPIVLSIIRYKDPSIKKKVRGFLQSWRIFRSDKNQLQKPLNSNRDSSHPGGVQNSQLQLSVSQRQERRVSSEDGSNWLSKLTQNLRMTQIYTMICGLIVSDITSKSLELQEKQRKIDQSQNSTFSSNEISISNPLVGLRDEDFTDTSEIQLNDDLLTKHIPQHRHENGLPNVEAKMIVHSPRVFRALQISDGTMADVSKSFDLASNVEAIQKKFGGPEGGKSGEFFYFAQDRKMIIKTMSDAELGVFKLKLKDYVHHLVLNEDSMIVKIYGIYSFTINQQVNHILVMRNITQCSSEYILRTFDLKGSTYDREVLAHKKNKDKNLSEMTLKDIDFAKTEQKIWIPGNLAKRCSQALEKDARFFEKCGLIDYSLVVFKINWVKYSINTGIELEDIQRYFHTDLNSIESTKEVGIFYHIGIIDYLQEWNVQKNLEKNTKKILNLQGNLDTSSQDQKIYADRFVTEIAQGLFPL